MCVRTEAMLCFIDYMGGDGSGCMCVPVRDTLHPKTQEFYQYTAFIKAFTGRRLHNWVTE